MRQSELQSWLSEPPFQPFRIHLTNGATFEVYHPDQAFTTPNTLILAIPTQLDPEVAPKRDVSIALLHIIYLEPIVGKSSSNGQPVK